MMANCRISLLPSVLKVEMRSHPAPTGIYNGIQVNYDYQTPKLYNGRTRSCTVSIERPDSSDINISLNFAPIDGVADLKYCSNDFGGQVGDKNPFDLTII